MEQRANLAEAFIDVPLYVSPIGGGGGNMVCRSKYTVVGKIRERKLLLLNKIIKICMK